MKRLNYFEFVETIKSICLQHPFVEDFYNGRYRLNSTDDISYPAIVYTFNDITTDPSMDHFRKTLSFNLLYADRLTTDRSNTDEIHSVGIDVLDEIYNALDNHFYFFTFTNYSLNLFKEQFADQTAGAIATITVNIPTNIGSCDWLDIKREC